MIKNPFFSIIIPTYNRANDLKFAIKCILMQNFENFELVISNNNSIDNTDDIVKGFKDKRIVYVKNKTNLGWIKSLKKAISLAKGKYILLQGDDDFVLYNNTLRTVYDLLKRENYGFVRVNYLSKIVGKDIVFDFRVSKHVDYDIKINSKEDNYKIIDFIEKVDPFFLTGIIFKNNFPKDINLIDSELVPWFKIIFYNICNFGGYYISKHFFVSSWQKTSGKSGHPFFNLLNGKFAFENYFKEIKNICSSYYYNKFLDKHLREIVKLLPANKFSSNNNNVINCSKRIIKLSSSYKFSTFFWFWFFFSLLTPKWILGISRQYFLKSMIHASKVKNVGEIKNRIKELEKEND